MPKKTLKVIFITGGVLSGLGKGIVASSIGHLLKARGYKVFMQKLDPYINYDAGTLNPGEHGECFVTNDGAETDLDLGHYERFTDENLTKCSSIMSGKIYSHVIASERRGDYLGQTVQVIPHITGAIKELVLNGAQEAGADIAVVEVGGTVGDYEGFHFLEAIRQLKADLGPGNTMYCHMVFLPYLAVSKEIKTRPAQYSIRELQGIGIAPNAIFCRADYHIGKQHLEKIALAASLPTDHVVSMQTAKTVYAVPLSLEESGVGKVIEQTLQLVPSTPPLGEWQSLVKKILSPKPSLTIGVIAKYTSMEDTYICVFESLRSAGWHHNVDIDIQWIDSEALEAPNAKVEELMGHCAGYIVPGGFGARGIEGKIKAAQYCRENNIPYLGLCLGMQIAVIEFARNVLGWSDANSTEFTSDSKHPVIHIMEHQKGVESKGGTMRLGAYPATLTPDTKTFAAYQSEQISERHRHRFEFNNEYRNQIEKAGLLVAGTSPDNSLVEIVELKNHPWFVAVQFHPEFKSRPNRPHPLFRDFVGAALVYGSELEVSAGKPHIKKTSQEESLFDQIVD